MEMIAKGKDAVIAYLEAESESRCGQVGEYLLTMDDSGNLIAIIAGRTLMGSGVVTLGGDRLTVVDGLVTSIQVKE